MPVFTPDLIARHAQTVQQQPAPPREHRKLHEIGLPVLIGGQVADIATTVQAIRSGRAREVNPAMGKTLGRMIAMKAATTAAEAYLIEKMAKDHPKAALVMALTLGGIGAGLSVHNSRVGK